MFRCSPSQLVRSVLLHASSLPRTRPQGAAPDLMDPQAVAGPPSAHTADSTHSDASSTSARVPRLCWPSICLRVPWRLPQPTQSVSVGAGGESPPSSPASTAHRRHLELVRSQCRKTKHSFESLPADMFSNLSHCLLQVNSVAAAASHAPGAISYKYLPQQMSKSK